MALKDSGKSLLAKLSGPRPPLEGLYPYAVALLVGYSAADLGILYFRPNMIPSESPPARPQKNIRQKQKSLSDYTMITERNIFNSDGKIPKGLAEDDNTTGDDGPAVKSNLPLKLLGTIVGADPKISVATINLSNRNRTDAFGFNAKGEGDEIDGIARITRIERRRVTFLNLNRGRAEYIELPEDDKITFGLKEPKTASAPQSGKFDFSLNKTEIDAQLKDLPNLISPKNIRMRPVTVNGRIEGYKFDKIAPGSVFEKLGLKLGDTMKQVNGERLDFNDYTRGMEMFNRLRSSNNIEIVIERDGREEVLRYNIN